MAMSEDEFPVLNMAEGAIGMHEMYLAYVNAGFTEAQAMQLLCALVRPHGEGGG